MYFTKFATAFASSLMVLIAIVFSGFVFLNAQFFLKIFVLFHWFIFIFVYKRRISVEIALPEQKY